VISLVRHLLLSLLCFSLCGCGIVSKAFHSHHKKDDDKDKQTKDLFIGTVEMVNPEQHFVLIRTGLQLKLQAGWKLETRPQNGSPKSVLVVTPEQKLNFLSADIADGNPQQGELVVLPPQAGLTSTAPATSAAPGNSAVPQPQGQPQPQPQAAPIRAPSGEILPPPIP
jgi:hypothetical protein